MIVKELMSMLSDYSPYDEVYFIENDELYELDYEYDQECEYQKGSTGYFDPDTGLAEAPEPFVYIPRGVVFTRGYSIDDEWMKEQYNHMKARN